MLKRLEDYVSSLVLKLLDNMEKCRFSLHNAWSNVMFFVGCLSSFWDAKATTIKKINNIFYLKENEGVGEFSSSTIQCHNAKFKEHCHCGVLSVMIVRIPIQQKTRQSIYCVQSNKTVLKCQNQGEQCQAFPTPTHRFFIILLLYYYSEKYHFQCCMCF